MRKFKSCRLAALNQRVFLSPRRMLRFGAHCRMLRYGARRRIAQEGVAS
jgi:hypothetical protein